jgi:hypothetical protein
MILHKNRRYFDSKLIQYFEFYVKIIVIENNRFQVQLNVIALQLARLPMESNDILASKTLIAAFDGFTNPYKCNFMTCQLAPDGKIYINSWGG